MAQLLDFYSDYVANTLVKPQTFTSSNIEGSGTGTDLLGYRGAILVAETGASGALCGESNKMTIAFVESSNNSTFTAIADTDLVGGNNTAVIDANGDANSTHYRSYIGTKRYVRVEFQATAGAVSIPVAASIVRGKPLQKR